MNLYPVKFSPIFKEKIWGGRNLERILGKDLPSGKQIGESWEICDRPQDQTIVANGSYAGKTLNELMILLKQALMGNAYSEIPARFPLLFKIIDAQEDLSLQVHPNDHYASQHEKSDPGKTEMWFVLYSENQAQIYCGLRGKYDAAFLKQHLSSPHIKNFLQIYPSKAGDVFFIPAGTVHALGKGNVVIEIQENSDLTYRLNDWGRTDHEGHTRPLHIEKGVQVIEMDPLHAGAVHKKSGKQSETLVQCPYFSVSEKNFNKSFSEEIHPEYFQVWIILEGEGVLEKTAFRKGDFILIPAHCGRISGHCPAPVRIFKILPSLQ